MEMSDPTAADPPMIVVASGLIVYAIDASDGIVVESEGITARRPACLAADPRTGGPVWCGTEDDGVFRSDDNGRSWTAAGLSGEHVSAVAVCPSRPARIWTGTEPSAVWRSDDAGRSWRRCEGLLELSSSPEWSFPPKPETHHVRWIACHPDDPDRAWFAIEAGALVSTSDGGQSWQDRVTGGPFDTHELAIHPAEPDHLLVAAGDGYFESRDGGRAWISPEAGLEVTYLRSVAIDPGDPQVVVVSASSRPRTAYVAGHADGRLYRREGSDAWKRVTMGRPEPPDTIAPLLAADPATGSLLAADEHGVHISRDGGRRWERLAALPERVDRLRGLVVTRSAGAAA
jgi:photosystem II stability/assembly factor-like uncharacterized protein